jgi:hypothetical protein
VLPSVHELSLDQTFTPHFPRDVGNVLRQDRRIAQLEVRRGNILAEIERRNDRMAQRLAAAVDVEDGQYSELAE